MKLTFQTTAVTSAGSRLHMGVETDIDPADVEETKRRIREVCDLHNLFHLEHQAWSEKYLDEHPELRATLSQPRPS